MKNLHIFFIYIIVLFPNTYMTHNLLAQYQKGYVIEKGGSIKNGKIELVYRFFEGSFIRFKDERGKKIKYQPEQIEGFGIQDTTYISLINLNFTPPNSHKEIQHDFAKVLVDDELSLYQFIYKKEQVWGATPKDYRFILKKSNNKKLYWLQNDINQIQTQLNEYFKEFPELQSTLATNGISPQNPLGSLVNYVRLYNKLLKEK